MAFTPSSVRKLYHSEVFLTFLVSLSLSLKYLGFAKMQMLDLFFLYMSSSFIDLVHLGVFWPEVSYLNY